MKRLYFFLIVLLLVMSPSYMAYAPKVTKPTFGEIYSSQYKQHPRYRGIVGHWIMAEGGGTKVRDISGFGNDGTFTNMVPASDWIHGQFGH